MKLKRLNEAKIEANIPRYLERFISNYHADIREFSVVKYIDKKGNEDRLVNIRLRFGDNVSINVNQEPTSDDEYINAELTINSWGSIGYFEDYKNVDSVIEGVVKTLNAVSDANKLLKELRDCSFEDLMVVK